MGNSGFRDKPYKSSSLLNRSLDMPSTTSNNYEKKNTTKSPIPKKKIKLNRDVGMMFGEISTRQNKDIAKGKIVVIN